MISNWTNQPSISMGATSRAVLDRMLLACLCSLSWPLVPVNATPIQRRWRVPISKVQAIQPTKKAADESMMGIVSTLPQGMKLVSRSASWRGESGLHDHRSNHSGGGAHGSGGDGAKVAWQRTSQPRKHVALAFYGLTRSLGYTADAIRENIFGALTDAGYTYDVYLHTYDLQNLTNSRSGEAAAPLNTSEWQLLEPHFHKVTSQVRILHTCGQKLPTCEVHVTRPCLNSCIHKVLALMNVTHPKL